MTLFRRYKIARPSSSEIHIARIRKEGDYMVAFCTCGYQDSAPLTCTMEERLAFETRLGTHDSPEADTPFPPQEGPIGGPSPSNSIH